MSAPDPLNPRGLPPGELVPAVRRSGADYDWQSVMVDPARLRPVKTTRIPRPGMTHNEVQEWNRRAEVPA
jgi:hypothetical protein